MPESNSPESPLNAAAGTVGPRTIMAFSVLGNETRLSILLALWEAYEPFGEESILSFSALRERLGRPDSGQFNYHLGKLEGLFIRKADGGYELSRAGHQLVRSIIAGAGIEEPTLHRTDVGQVCHLCGAPVHVAYENGLLLRICTECDGRVSGRDAFPKGTLDAVDPNPAGFTNRNAREVWDAAETFAHAAILAAIEGTCTDCWGPMEGWLDLCQDHATEGVCPTCGRRNVTMAHFRCSVCKQNIVVPVEGLIRLHPAVISFFFDHGVFLTYDAESAANRRVGGLGPSLRFTEKLLTEDPPRVRTTIEYGGETLRLTLAEDLAVTGVQRT